MWHGRPAGALASHRASGHQRSAWVLLVVEKLPMGQQPEMTAGVDNAEGPPPGMPWIKFDTKVFQQATSSAGHRQPDQALCSDSSWSWSSSRCSCSSAGGPDQPADIPLSLVAHDARALLARSHHQHDDAGGPGDRARGGGDRRDHRRGRTSPGGCGEHGSAAADRARPRGAAGLPGSPSPIVSTPRSSSWPPRSPSSADRLTGAFSGHWRCPTPWRSRLDGGGADRDPSTGVAGCCAAPRSSAVLPLVGWLPEVYTAGLSRIVIRPGCRYLTFALVTVVGVTVYPPSASRCSLLSRNATSSSTGFPARHLGRLDGTLHRQGQPGTAGHPRGAQHRRSHRPGVPGRGGGRRSTSARSGSASHQARDYTATLDRIPIRHQRLPGLFREVQTYLDERIQEVLTGGKEPIIVRTYGDDLPVLRRNPTRSWPW